MLAAVGVASLSITPAFGAEKILVDQNAKKTPAYVLLQAQMIDRDMFFNQYAVPAEVEVDRNGGHARVATFDKAVMEGAWNNNWTIILRFPSMQNATSWYHSPGYQAVVPYRHASTAYGNMVFFNGIGESVLNWSVAAYRGAKPQLKFPLTLDSTPEYVVTALPGWTSRRGFCYVRAAFDALDLRGAKLSFELKLRDGSAQDLAEEGTVFVRDTAGERWPLTRIHLAATMPGWQAYSARIPASRIRLVAGDGELPFVDLANADAIEFEFRATASSLDEPTAVQVRNLKVVEDD